MTAHPGLPVNPTPQEIARKVNHLLIGHLNVTQSVTLTLNVATTVLSDSRIGANSAIIPMPLHVNAAAEIGNGTLWFGAPGDSTVTINHANSATADRTFRFLIVG